MAHPIWEENNPHHISLKKHIVSDGSNTGKNKNIKTIKWKQRGIFHVQKVYKHSWERGKWATVTAHRWVEIKYYKQCILFLLNQK